MLVIYFTFKKWLRYSVFFDWSCMFRVISFPFFFVSVSRCTGYKLFIFSPFFFLPDFLRWYNCHHWLVILFIFFSFSFIMLNVIWEISSNCSFSVLDWNYIWNTGVVLGQFTTWKNFRLGWAGYSTGGNGLYS